MGSAATPTYPPPVWLVALGLFSYLVAGLLSGMWEVMFVPLRIGSTIAPVSVVAAIATNVGLPQLSKRIRADALGAMAPFAGWLIAVFVLAMGRPEGDVFLTAGSSDAALVGYFLLAAGFLTGVVSVLRAASGALADGRDYRRSQPGFRL